jgi:FAD/FMN-containing dehydrogenase
MSRYMNRIIEINPEEGGCEAGVIKDQLNQFLNRTATFCAGAVHQQPRHAWRDDQHRCVRAGLAGLRQNLRSRAGVRSVLMGGDILDTQPMPVALAETLGAEQSAIGRIYRTVYQRCKAQRQLIIDKFPKLNRFLTGYDLRHVFNDEMSEFDLTRILTGSEGTLAFITEARLDITRLPKVRRLVNVKYDSFDSALRNAPFMVEAKALSVETVDSKVLNLAREDIVWHSVSELITDVRIKRCWG